MVDLVDSTASEDKKNPDERIAKQPTNNDFVIREGFPALRLADGSPWIDGDEPVPRHSFWAHETALTLNSLHMLHTDCETVFSARAKENDQAYSAGVTYFCPCQMKPRCALEALVLDIFRKHTEALDKSIFIPEQSGAEWWTLVLDEEEAKSSDNNKEQNKNGDDDDEEEEESDEVGMHFDADYGLEDQAPNLLLHPRLGTVTYLSDCGAPTVIFNQRSPPPNDVEKKTLNGPIDKCWLSHPKIGKHIAFDGRLLHGAPATFFPGRKTLPKQLENDEDDSKQPPNKKQKQEEQDHVPGKRYTLLVNIWLNHCPLDAEPLEDEIVEKLITPCKPATETADANSQIVVSENNSSIYTWNKDCQPATRGSDACQKILLVASTSDPAGEEEVVICSRRLTIHYNASMEDLHQASSQASLVELELGKDVIVLAVGDVVEEESEAEAGQEGD